jgi:uncharacterized protein
MSAATVAAAGRRIAEHASTHELAVVDIVLHGGEPLLAGTAAVDALLGQLRSSMPPGTEARFAVQTNGVLLDEQMLRVLGRHGVRIGISLDGGGTASDRHRRRADGRSSHADVVRALRLLAAPPWRALFAGLLCTIDLANDPVACYAALAEFEPPMVDFLLPLGNWSRPPPGRAAAQGDGVPGATGTPYADWLLAVFEHWYRAPGELSVRLFDEIIGLLLGGRPATEFIGGALLGFLVVETDGAIEGADTLKSAYHGAAHTGMSVFRDSFDEVLGHPALAAQRQGRAGLCGACLACPVVDVCGGGQYAHRYRAGDGFGNPSVYCADLQAIIGHVGRRVLADLATLRGGIAAIPPNKEML